MYTYEHRAKAVSRELGYPHLNFIVRWYKEYLANGDLKHSYQRGQKYSKEQKQHALQYYEEHGRCASQTLCNLGAFCGAQQQQMHRQRQLSAVNGNRGLGCYYGFNYNRVMFCGTLHDCVRGNLII